MIARKIHLWVTEVGGLALVEAVWSVPIIPVTVTNVRFSYNFWRGSDLGPKIQEKYANSDQGAGEKVSRLKALLRHEFTDAVRSVTVMVSPSRGAATRPGMTYLRGYFHNPGVLPPDTGDNR